MNTNRLQCILLLFLAALTAVLILSPAPAMNYPGTELTSYKNVSDDVIRLHILADNDSTQAQEIKLYVRDCLLPYLNQIASQASSKEAALCLLRDNTDLLTEVANDALKKRQADYIADVSVTSCYFPLRIYGSQTFLSKNAILFPPDEYDTINVILGNGNGHNWWCLAYPSLCFIDASYEYVPLESKEYNNVFSTLENHRLNSLFYSGFAAAKDSSDSSVPMVFRCKLWMLFKSLFEKE